MRWNYRTLGRPALAMHEVLASRDFAMLKLGLLAGFGTIDNQLHRLLFSVEPAM